MRTAVGDTTSKAADGCDVMIVGGGIIGAAIFQTACQNELGHVTLLERGTYASGATRESGGIVRCSDCDPTIRALAIESIEHFQAMPIDLDRGEVLWRPTGVVTLLDCDDALTQARWAEAMEHDGAHAVELVGDPHGVIEVAGVRLDRRLAVFEPRAGSVAASAMTSRWIAEGVAAGGTALEDVRVLAVQEDGDGVTVLSTAGTTRAQYVVLAVGAWHRTIAMQLLGGGWSTRTRTIQASHIETAASGFGHAACVDLRTGSYAVMSSATTTLVGLPRLEWGMPAGAIVVPSTAHHRLALRQASAYLPWAKSSQCLRTVCRVDGYVEARGDGVIALPGSSHCLHVRAWNGGGVKVAPAVAQRICLMLDECRGRALTAVTIKKPRACTRNLERMR